MRPMHFPGSFATGVTLPAAGPNILPMQYWLVKTEPGAYAWAKFVAEGRTAWTGVRNFQARNHLRGMKKADLVLFYHSGTDKAVQGYARVAKTAYPDPTADEGDWCCVDLAPVKALKQPVTLSAIKHCPALKDMLLLKQTRLSVVPVTAEQFVALLQLGGETVSRPG
jgi:predicted RNA-binding protein with PUA-like domain